MITLTKDAIGAARVGITPERPYLRVGVQGGGCSGFSYELGYDESYDPKEDVLFEQGGLKIIADKKSMLYLDGTVISYFCDDFKTGFSFENPNAVKSCGCGSSFQA